MKSRSNVFVMGFMFTICMVIVNSAHFNYRNRPRATRGFKNAALSTARGFGKRDGLIHSGDTLMDVPLESKKQLFEAGFSKNFPDFEKVTIDRIVEEILTDPRLLEVIKKIFIEIYKAKEQSMNIFQSLEYEK